ncbi:COG4223 family protein [Microbulbifer sp. S227A]|uniref:COG4223 family protein n=1 Tax=Microbulbifer sp. S227A TaxID=3415131 RepID=UPI003C7C6ABC
MAEKKTPEHDQDADGQTEPDKTDVETDAPDSNENHATPDPDQDLQDALAPAERVIEKEKIIETRSGFGSALFGGIVAATIGFIAARSDAIDPYLPDFLRSQDLSGEIAELQSGLAAQTDAVSAVSGKVGAIKLPDLAPVEASIADLTTQVAPLGERIDALRGDLADMDKRLTEVAKRPIDEGVSEAAIAAYEKELADLQKAMATQRGEVEGLIADARAIKAEAGALEANAAKAAQQAANRATMAQLRAALDAGAPFAAQSQELKSAGVDVPADLEEHAAEGVATLTALNNSFPPAARAALAAARAETKDEDRGIGAFFKRQLGARSVEPRDGDDPDAILSRAEAAVADGQLDAALSDIALLPETAQAAMGTWVDRAHARQVAVTAADSLAASLNTN